MPASRATKPASSKSNPFDSDSDSEFTSKPTKTSSSYSVDPGAKSRYKNALHDSGGFENQSVQELESYAAYKAEETTQKVNDCLRLAENIREDATNTLITLHKQGEQINRTHETAANIDQDLSRTFIMRLIRYTYEDFGYSTPEVRHSQNSGSQRKLGKERDQRLLLEMIPSKRRANHLEQRDKLGLFSSPRGKSNPRKYSDPTNAMEKVQVEKDKQDNTLSDLSDVLGQLKGMALDMDSEIDRQNKAIDALQDDVDELNSRVKGANQRVRRLIGK